MKIQVLFLLSLVGIESGFCTTSPSLTLRQVYQAAKEKTEAIAQGQSQIHQSEAVKDQVFSRFLPSLSLGASSLYQDRTTGFNSQTQASTRLIMTQSLYEGGKDRAQLQMANTEIAAREQNLNVVEITLFIDVARSFFTVLAAEQDIVNIQKSIALTEDRIKELQKRMKVGKTQNVEVLAAEAQQSVLKSQLLTAQGTQNISRDTFARVTGLDRSTPLTDPMRFPKEPKSIDSYLEEIENRPDIKALKLAIESSSYQVQAAQAGHLPSIFFTGNGYLAQWGIQNGNNRNWDVSLSLSLPIFAGGIIDARIRESRELETQAELLLKNRKRVAEEEIRKAYSKLSYSLEQVKSLEKALAVTEENYKEQVNNYRFSLTTNLDVIQALNTLQDTKRALDRTRFEALVAWAELRAATARVLN